MDDDDIREALRRGRDEAAFRLLVRSYGRAIYDQCLRTLRERSAAEDAMQATLMAAFENRTDLLEVEHLRAWLGRVAYRKCMDALRSSKRLGRLQRDLPEAGEQELLDLVDLFGANEEKQALEECLARLEPTLALALVMRFRDDLGWERIATTLEVAADAIRMRVRRVGIPSLRACLDAKEIKR